MITKNTFYQTWEQVKVNEVIRSVNYELPPSEQLETLKRTKEMVIQAALANFFRLKVGIFE